MSDCGLTWHDQYIAALRAYIARPEETALERAYELGRQVMMENERGMIDLVAAYHQELATQVRAARTPDHGTRVLALAQTFFNESLSAFILAQGGFRDTITRLRDLRGLLEFQQEISGEYQVARVRERIVLHGSRLLGGACALLQQNPDGHWARGATTMEEGPRPGTPTVPDQELVAQAIQARTPVILDTGSSTNRATPDRRTEPALLGVALRSGTQVLGVLAFQASSSTGFSASDLTLAQLIAEYAAQALGRARLLDEIQEQNTALEANNRQLVALNEELEAFSYSVSHDLRAPLRAIAGFSQILLDDYGSRLDDEGRGYLADVIGASGEMGQLIDALLRLSRVTRAEMRHERVDLSAMARVITATLAAREPEQSVTVSIMDGLEVIGDAALLRVALENLLGNSWKFTRHTAGARIEVGSTIHEGQQAYWVRDNGVGFNMAYAHNLFGAFRRLHGTREFEGTGIGLATVQRIIHRHGGRIWADGAVGQGATFSFTLNCSMREEETAE